MVTSSFPGDATPCTSRPSASVTRTSAPRTTLPGPATPTRSPTSPPGPQSTVQRVQSPLPSRVTVGVPAGRQRAGRTGSSSAPRGRTSGVFHPTSASPPADSRISSTHGASGWARAIPAKPRTPQARSASRIIHLSAGPPSLDNSKKFAVSHGDAIGPPSRDRPPLDPGRLDPGGDSAVAADRITRAVCELRPAPEPVLRRPAHPHPLLRRRVHLRHAGRPARRLRLRARRRDPAHGRRRAADPQRPDRPPPRFRRGHRSLRVLRRGPPLRHARLARLRYPSVRAAPAGRLARPAVPADRRLALPGRHPEPDPPRVLHRPGCRLRRCRGVGVAADAGGGGGRLRPDGGVLVHELPRLRVHGEPARRSPPPQ